MEEICEDCEIKVGKRTFCPYEEELYDDKVPVVLCEECYHQRFLET